MVDILARLYKDTMNVIGTVHVTDETTGIESSDTQKTLYTGIPCRISYSEISPSEEGDVPQISQSIKVFCSTEYNIPEGSILEVTRKGQTDSTTYQCSGKPAFYDDYLPHQEITVKLVKEYA